jgi:hypothetical protein
MSCQTLTYDKFMCQTIFNIAVNCIQKVNGTLDALIQYLIIPGSNPSGSSFLTNPTSFSIFKQCICDSTENQIQFLVCFNNRCASDWDQMYFSEGGVFLSALCLSKSTSNYTSTSTSTNEWLIPESNQDALNLLPKVASSKSTGKVKLALELPYAYIKKNSNVPFQSLSWFTLANDAIAEVNDL